MRLPIVIGVLAAATLIPAWWPDSVTETTRTDAPIFGKAGIDAAQISDVVVTTRKKDGDTQVFQVKRAEGQWVIATSWNYPADANTRVTKVVNAVLGLERGPFVTDDATQFEKLELADPTAKDTAVRDGFGKVVKLSDSSGAVVLNLIIGKASPLGQGQRYVREVGSNRVFTAKMADSDITTKFTDYVETSPFKIQRDDIRGITIADYSVDEAQGGVVPRSDTRFARPYATTDWASPQAPNGKKASKATLDALIGQITGQQLVSVRPFEVQWLQPRGFFLSQNPQIIASPLALRAEVAKRQFAVFGNEGRVDVTTKDGLRYSMLFGEVAVDDALDTADRKVDEKDKKKEGENRYLAVFVTYDESKDEDAKKEKEEAAKKSEDKTKPAEPPKKKVTGRERAAKAQARYQQFFYVISDSSFKQLRPETAKLWEDLPKEPMAGNTGKTNVQWLADHAKEPGITVTASGLQYRVDAKGPGGKQPTAASKVKVNYKGTKLDGSVFDESAKHGGPAEFELTGVVKGWTEGIPLMQVGDKFTFWLPPEIAYGDKGPPDIGPNQILQFEVELVEVLSNPAPEMPKAEVQAGGAASAAPAATAAPAK